MFSRAVMDNTMSTVEDIQYGRGIPSVATVGDTIRTVEDVHYCQGTEGIQPLLRRMLTTVEGYYQYCGVYHQQCPTTVLILKLNVPPQYRLYLSKVL